MPGYIYIYWPGRTSNPLVHRTMLSHTHWATPTEPHQPEHTTCFLRKNFSVYGSWMNGSSQITTYSFPGSHPRSQLLIFHLIWGINVANSSRTRDPVQVQPRWAIFRDLTLMRCLVQGMVGYPRFLVQETMGYPKITGASNVWYTRF